MPTASVRACAHCQLPVGSLAQQRELNGEAHWFCCYGCCLAFQVHQGANDEPQAAAALIRLGVGGFLTMNIMLFSLLLYSGAFDGDDAWLRQPVHCLLWLLATPLVIVLGGPFFVSAGQALRRGRLSTDALVSIGVLAAYGYSGWQVLRGSPLVYFDTASMVLVLFTLGRYVEAQGRVRAARSLAPMLAAERAEVRVLEGGAEAVRPVLALRPDDLFRVLPGERIAVDGVVIEGVSDCDEAVLTGQSQRQPKQPGALVIAGSVNGNGALVIRATVAGAQTRWIRISAQVRSALASKSLAGQTVERFVALFIPAVLGIAAASAWYWAGRSGSDAALLAGLAVLVVACPCSLGLAAPLAHALAIGDAAQRGILVRGGVVFERLVRLRGIAFDKTGTLTLQALEPVRFTVDGAAHGEALRYATLLARCSAHPASLAIAALGHAVESSAVQDIEARPGQGTLGRIDGDACALGSAALLRTLGWDVPDVLVEAAPPACSLVFIGWRGRARALIALRAAAVPEAAAVIGAVRERGLLPLLLSGDAEASVAEMAAALGVQDWQAELLPEDKVDALHRWTARHGAVAMVGDGLNDGPVLAAASVGIAVGHATDLARESADVVLPPGGLDSLPWLLDVARATQRSVRANVLWAFGYNAIALTLAAGGVLQPAIAAGLMAGSSLVVVWRSWRAGSRNANIGAMAPAPTQPVRWSAP
jgi:Cu2+-exporting ATPase